MPHKPVCHKRSLQVYLRPCGGPGGNVPGQLEGPIVSSNFHFENRVRIPG